MTVDEMKELVARLVKRHGTAERVSTLLKGAATARSVLRHAEGSRKPTPTVLKKYVALDAKTTPKPKEAPFAKADAPPVFDRAKPTLDAVIELASRADGALQKALDDRDASHRDRSGAIHTLSRVLRELAMLRGELEPTEASILRSAAWARCMGVIVEVLKGYPEAARAVAIAIDALEEHGS